MYTYILIALFIAVLIYKYDVNGYNCNRSFWERFTLIVLILMVGLRYHVGSDTVVYEWNFNTVATPRLDDLFKDEALLTQPLWLFVMSFCKTIFGTFVAVQFFHAIVFHLLAFRFIKKTTPYTFTALIFLFILLWFANSFEVLRESIASVIFLNSLFFLKEKKYLYYVLCGIVATGFHAFSFIVFILSVLVVLSNKKVLIVLCITFFLVVQVIDFSAVNRMIMAILSVSDTLSNKAKLYVGVEDASIFSFLGFLRWIILDIFLPLLVIIFSCKKDDFFIKLVILWLMLTQLTSKLPILYRMDNYYELIYIVLLVNVLYDKRNILNRQIRTILVTLSFFVLVMGYMDVYRPDMNFQSARVSYDIRYFPYKTIFQNPDPLREAQDYYH